MTASMITLMQLSLCQVPECSLVSGNPSNDWQPSWEQSKCFISLLYLQKKIPYCYQYFFKFDRFIIVLKMQSRTDTLKKSFYQIMSLCIVHCVICENIVFLEFKIEHLCLNIWFDFADNYLEKWEKKENDYVNWNFGKTAHWVEWISLTVSLSIFELFIKTHPSVKNAYLHQIRIFTNIIEYLGPHLVVIIEWLIIILKSYHVIWYQH